MCTVTIVPVGVERAERIRLACNRDEKRSRRAALPPVVRTFGNRKAILPIDPVSDGTWIAVNDAGLAATLLNVNPADARRPPAAGRDSRGTIIPRLMHCESVADGLAIARELDPLRFPPFRLVLLDPARLAEVRSDGQSLVWNDGDLALQPVMFTSSGLGDELVERPRRELFEEMFSQDGDPLVQQARFHQHQWPDRPQLSVRMSRADACTVSLTIVEIDGNNVALSYLPYTGEPLGKPSVLSLRRQGDVECPR